jgi:hypothetical protein
MIKRFLVAKSPAELERAQLRNNIAGAKAYSYEIVHDGSKWYAWFLTDGSNLLAGAKEKALGVSRD